MAPQQCRVDATSPDGRADHGAELIARNRALLAQAGEARERAEHTVLHVRSARDMRSLVKATSAKAVQITAQSSARPVSGDGYRRNAGLPQYVQRLQADAMELHARVQALVATAKPPGRPKPD